MKGGLITMNTMNKKIVLSILAIFAVGFVAALGYYTLFSTSFSVLPSLSIEGDLEQSLGEVYAGETVRGSEVTITNDAPTERTITLTNDADEDVEVSYVSSLQLSQKVVDFTLDVWELLPAGNVATIEYTLVGSELTAEVTDGSLVGYTLVYYKDSSDRFSSPAKVIPMEDVTLNLPYEDDQNADEYDYCGEYVTCHGAKVWYIPTDSFDTEGTVDWSRASEFLFETRLIQYGDSITIYPGDSLGITPLYDIGAFASGEKIVTTTVA